MTVERITAKHVNDRFEDHITKHRDVYDPMLKNHNEVLFGKNLDNGMCADVRDIKKGYETMRAIGVAILIALISNFILFAVK
jgi:hypothetical protein